MTTRNNRRFRRAPRGFRRRTARRVWVNSASLTIPDPTAGVVQVDLLTNAETFMKFDSTVLAIHLLQLTYTGQHAATEGRIHFGAYIREGASTLDVADQPVPLALDGDDSDFMWMGRVSTRQSANAGAQRLSLAGGLENPPGGLTIRTKRRLKENNQSLWLVMEVDSASAVTNGAVSHLIRTLLLVP